jgi:hypothetical protein
VLANSHQCFKVSRHTFIPLGDFMLLATHLLHIHNEPNRSTTNKFKSAVNANQTVMHKQHHHRPPHTLDAMFIFLLASTVGTAHIHSGAGHSQSSRFNLLGNGRINTFPQQ